jgi:D-amino-acid dehydrogenase
MKIVIIGSGLIGVTTAYFLGRSGHEVTVLDRQSGPGLETSFANGALLHPSMPEPWNSPGCWRVLLASLGRADAALKIRLRALPSLLHWGSQFLRNSKVAAFERNSLSNLRLARYSLDVMSTLRQQANIEYGRVARGSLRIFREGDALDRADGVARDRVSEGLSCRRLSSSEVVDLEPALEPIAASLKGGLHYQCDEIGDAHRFCVELTESARRCGVDFQFGTEVTCLRLHRKRVVGVECRKRQFVAEHYIVAAGSYSSLLLRPLGVELPVRPAKGYSITAAADPAQAGLRIPVIDDQMHAAVVPLGSSIRVAGTAEFAGYNLDLQPARIGNLVGLLKGVLPRTTVAADRVRPWCGLRPLSADGVPIIGETEISNLMVNTGHGHLGWTMAAGSGQLLTDLLCGRSPAIDPRPFNPGRFGSRVM